MNKLLRGWMMLAFLTICSAATAGTQTVAGMSAQDYDFYAGDFNGDGYTDLLFIAKDPSHSSGIILSDGTALTIPLQTWGNAYLGIPWSAGMYTVIVADFNGDGKADILLQRNTPGDSYLLLTEDGGVGAISQTIANSTAGVIWSADQHHIVAGDFNGDGKADIFLQATSPGGLNAIIEADANGQFTAKAPAQSWNDGYLGFNWATSEALVFSGDFNGDGRSDLLLQALPAAGTGPGTSQQALFPPNLNGVVLSKAGAQMFIADGVQAWSRLGFGADWSPLDSVITVGDFNGDGRSDVLLQGAGSLNPSYVLYGNVPGPIFSMGAAINTSFAPTADNYHVLAGHFDGTTGDSLFLQGQNRALFNYIGHLKGATLTTAPQMLAVPAGSTSGTTAPLAGSALPAIVTANAAGRTPGQFAISPTGGATYTIPIWTPPGARGIAPHLSLVYVSGSSDGPLGPGWNLGGLSTLTRCNQTYAENGTPAVVALTLADNFCLDGNRLRLTAGTYGVAGSTYQTEIANFSNVTAYGTAGAGPSYFIVQGKDGLIYEYGNTADSKAYTTGGSTPYSWLLNKIRDRQGNNLTVSYSTTSGWVQPASIQYTQTPATGTTYPYSVAFTYQTRVTNLSKYIAGGNIALTKVLNTITVNSSGTQVRQYSLAYATAPTTQRDRLTTVQECAGTNCLQPTNIVYQNGTAGTAAPSTASGSGATNGTVYTADVDGDGKQDLVFATTSGTNYLWWVQFATATGYGAPISTGAVTNAISTFVIDTFDSTGQAEILAPVGGVWYLYKWNGTSFTATSTGTAWISGFQYASADVDGDGRPDLIGIQPTGTPGMATEQIQLNTSNSSGVSFVATPVVNYLTLDTQTLRALKFYGSNKLPNSPVQHFDFDGDGRQDLLLQYTIIANGNVVYHAVPMISRGTGAPLIPALGLSTENTLPGILVAVNWNDDACTDLVFDAAIWIAQCNGSAANSLLLPASPQLALDWDGDGRTDLLANVGGTWELYRSLGTGFAAGVSTGIAVGSGTWVVTDQNGDGLNDLLYTDPTTGAISYGLHNGSSAPADYLTSITDGWGINASPTYVPISQNNYTKYSDAAFPDFDFQGPMYVVSQSQQSDGTGSTFTNSLWYYGAHVNRQGRGFGGFYATRTVDSRNGLMRYVYYMRSFPYIGAVFEDDVYQPDGATIISHNVNSWTYKPLVGSDCSVRCFPYANTTTSVTHDIASGAPLIATVVKNFTYDNYGNATQLSSTITDNNSASPFYNLSWLSVVTNTISPDAGSNWCLDKPTVSTTQNTVPGQSSQTRQVNHAVDYVNCRFTQETMQPGDSRLQVTTNFGFDGCGNINSVSIVGLDQNGATMPARTTTSGYGTHCEFAETVTNALSQVTTTGYRYDIGVKSSVTDPNNVTVSWLSDGFARRIKESRPDGTSTTWSYVNCTSTNCTGASDLRLLLTETLFDSASNTVRTHEQFSDGLERLRFDEVNRVLGTWTIQSTKYDGLGRKTSVDVPYSAASNGYHQFTYDLLSRPSADQLYDSSGTLNRQTTMTYAGLASSMMDAKSNTTIKTTDVAGKLRQIVDPSPGGTTKYTYDPFGNLITVLDAVGVTTSYTYNIRGFKTSSVDPDAGTSTYTPDSLNEIVSQTDAKNQTISFGYDGLGRMTSRLEPESTTATTFTYGTSPTLHNIGRVQSVAKPDGYAESYSFDSIGRPQTTIYTEDTSYQVDFAYNALGSLDTVTYPTSTSGYRFAAKYLYSYGYLQQVKDDAAGTVFWSLSAANDSSLPTTELLGNGAQVSSTYTPWTNDLTARSEGTSGSTNNLQNLTYSWDLNQNLQQRVDVRQSLTEVFVNDSMNRLTSSTLNGSPNLTVSYDAAGNITSKSDVGSYDYTTNQSGCTYYTNTQPHAVRNVGGSVYCYDSDGNMTSRAGNTISWFSYNQPNLISYGSNSTQFKYNASHRRWMQSANFAGTPETTYYVGGLLEKLVRSTVTEYRHQIPIGSGTTIYTRRTDSTNGTYYVTSDHLGSGDLVIDSSANVLARESFTPFGARRGSNWQGVPTTGDYSTFDTTTRRGFTGHEMLDGVSLIHMNGRVYDPYLGRFLSPDPVVSSVAMSQSLNPFSYVMNNPLTLTDPSGYSWLSSIEHFIKTYWRPIVAIVVAIVAWYVAGPYLSAALTPAGAIAAGTATASATFVVGETTVGLEATAFIGGGITAVGGAFAGAIGGAIAGGILAGWHGALLGALSGALFGAIGGAYGNSWDLSRVGLTSAAGGISSDASGRGFWRGFEVALAVSLISWGYQAANQGKYDPQWSGGDGHEDKPPEGYTGDARGYGASGNYDHWGNAWGSPLTSPPHPWSENGWFSRFMDSIYGQNATAVVHDNIMAGIFNSLGQFAYYTTFVPSMPVALGMAYTTLAGPASAAIIEDNR
jgi:RHS repeat-associated protein